MNILMLRHSAGFEHSYLPDAEVALKQIGAANGWSVTTTHRCDRITAENLEKQDIVAFATTGNLAFDDAQKEALLNFVRNGISRLKRSLASTTQQIRAMIGPNTVRCSAATSLDIRGTKK